jgi:LuxR family transcriptional regulator, maltose regulon positive regulatory protein
MSRAPLHALTWSQEQRLYELYTQGRLKLRLQPTDEATWQSWLGSATSFAFHGKGGSLNVYREQRPHGGAYWYAYHTKEGRTRKRYLGRMETLSLARLEETAQALWWKPQPTQGMLVLSGKLAPPRLPNSLVEREHLLTCLDEALATRLLLLSAPAGFGKTTLLSTWANRHQAQVAWLSLEELDNTPTRFWVALIAALRRCPRLSPYLGETVLARLQSPQPPPLSSLLTALLHELESREVPPAPLVLILDDYQVIEEQAIHEGLTFWVEHLPAHLHLLLASRVDPDLPLARWRARGQLCEIRADDLRFQESEASHYLGQMLSSPLSEEEVQGLTSRTEGWIAGLHLAALTLQKREDRTTFLQAFTGSQRYLLDYVQQDILAPLSTPVRDFLLHAAILSRLDASVCQVVTAAPTREASQQMLEWLERANLFVVPLDEERHSYRLHDLFREALLSVLHATHPELAPLLHRRVAAFYEAEGDFHEAITHALQAADLSTAAHLMEQTVEEFWGRGEAATMARWVLALPEQTVREHAHLLLTTALSLLYTVTQTTRERRIRISQEAQLLMARVKTLLQQTSGETDQEIWATRAGALSHPKGRAAPRSEDILLHRRLRLLHLHLVFWEAVAQGDDERLQSMQPEIEEALEREEEPIWQLVPLACSFLLHYIVRQEGASLVPQLLTAYERAIRSGSPYAIYKVSQWLAMATLEAGQLRLAYEESLAALDLIEQRGGFALLKGYFEIVLARVFYQWNRLEEARSLLDTVVQDATAWQHLDVLGEGYIELVEVELARREWSEAFIALHELERRVQRERSAVFSGRLSIVRVQWWLAQGQLKEASDWVTDVLFPEGPWDRSLYDAFPVVIRVYFAQLRFREALSLLERWSAYLDRPANIRITITYLVQLLVALHQTGESEQTRRIAARLFVLTEPESYIRVYLDEGEPMREALQALLSPPSQQHALASFSRTYVAKLLAAFQQKANGAGTSLQAALKPEPAPAPSRKSSRSSDGLTAREVEVLRLLAAGLTDVQIAEQLVISPRTVNVHLTSIYSKISVSSRVAATRYAIEHHLA